MRCGVRNAILAVLTLAAGCSVKLPEGRFKCAADADCPSGWVCSDALCYREAPTGTGHGGSSANGGTQGMNDAGGVDFDAGIDITSCDAFTTFYRDSDDDGLGVATDSVAACSVMNGYVTNRTDCDDSCSACTTSVAEEVCDGFDNECDGKVDDGQLRFSTRVSFEGLPNAPWAETVETADGAIMFSQVKIDDVVTIQAQRFSADGVAIGDTVPVPGAVPSAGGYSLAADVLDGKILLAWFGYDGVHAIVLKASDLSVLVPAKKIAGPGKKAPALDVALSSSASGGRAMFAYENEGSILVQGYRLSDLALDTAGPKTIYTPTDLASALPMVTLAAGPCLSGFYAVVLDEFLGVLRVVPLGDDGKASGTVYDVPKASDQFFTALPALRVEGGSCDAAPTRLVLGYATASKLLGASTSQVHLDYLTITRATDLDSFNLAGSASFEQSGSVLLAYYFTPGGYVFIGRALDIAAYAGRYLVAVASAASVDADRAALDVAEIEGNALVAKYRATDLEPVGPKSIELVVLQGKPWLAASFWSNSDPAGLLRIGCAP